MMTLACVSQCMAQPQEFSNWPAGDSPAEVGKRVAENFVVRKFDFETNPRRQYVIYPEVCTWYGSLTVAKLINDPNLTARLVKKFDPLLGAESKRISPNDHVDYRVFGAVPLEIYMQTKDKRYLEIGQGLADKQWENPTEDGITREARYWIDDMFMIPAVQVQTFRATNDAKYIDRAALAMAAYLDRLQQPNGLFYHAPDVPFFWGRGNGWVAAGMTELLRSLPADHPKRARVMEGYKKMMAALLAAQDPNGMWHQLVDKPDFWPETSGTGMFAFAMVTGVKSGWLDAKTYAPAARKAWLGLVKYIDKDANVREVCVGTNKLNDLQYYLNRPRNTGDLHGQAPLLWTATALLR
jgi:rhamnogalacturonyl hydrolase YesR